MVTIVTEERLRSIERPEDDPVEVIASNALVDVGAIDRNVIKRSPDGKEIAVHLRWSARREAPVHHILLRIVDAVTSEERTKAMQDRIFEVVTSRRGNEQDLHRH